MRPPGVMDLAPGIVVSYLPVALVVLVLVGASLLAIRSRRVGRAEALRTTLLDLAAGTWLALALLVTVVPIGGRPGRMPIGFLPFLDAFDRLSVGLTTPMDEVSDIVLNVLLFVPFGAWAALRLGRTWTIRSILGGALLSVGIEVSQALEAAGRLASATDVVTNTTGTALGFLLVLRMRNGGPKRPLDRDG